MHVGICEITIRLHDVTTLKAKRQVTQSVITTVRNRWNVSAAEVEHQDDRCLFGLGLGAVSGSRKVIDGTFAAVLRHLERDRRLDVETYDQTWL